MTVVALMAAGAHALSLTAPALAEQSPSATEHAIVPHAPTAASDGLPVPILIAGVVLAFAVGLSAGAVHRRRRVARSVSVAPGPAPVAEPAPPEPEVSEPLKPAPPPPEPKAPEPRVVAPPLAPVPPPPEPPREETPRPAEPAPPLRLVRRASEPKPEPQRAPEPEVDVLDGEAPERPQPVAAAVQPPTPPLADAPESLRVPVSAEAPEPQLPPPGPARRFARMTPWPADATELWTCELDWKAGYLKASFRAMVAGPGEEKRHPLGASAPVRWALMGEPEPPTPELAVRVRSLVQALEAAGWEHIGRGRRWYQQRFVWRAAGDPQPISLPEGAESTEG
jgi:hypothetical protein